MSEKVVPENAKHEVAEIRKVFISVEDRKNRKTQDSNEAGKRQRSISAESYDTRSSKNTKIDEETEDQLLRGSKGSLINGDVRFDPNTMEWDKRFEPNNEEWDKVDQLIGDITLDEKVDRFLKRGYVDTQLEQTNEPVDGNEDLAESSGAAGGVSYTGTTRKIYQAKGQRDDERPNEQPEDRHNQPLTTNKMWRPVAYVPKELVIAPTEEASSTTERKESLTTS